MVSTGEMGCGEPSIRTLVVGGGFAVGKLPVLL